MAEQHQFQAEVGRLLDIVANALYTEREIFLRELISNAADACDRLRYEAIAKPALLSGDADLKIDITFDTGARILKISDNGIGMDREALMRNLGTIAHSGTRELMKTIKTADEENAESSEEAAPSSAEKPLNLIGQFGVGFYSAFMVATKVEVVSRPAGGDIAHIWVSDGRGAYTIDESLKDTRGTEIMLHLKDEAGEFLLEERLKTVVKKYSDHVGFPITVQGKTVNAGAALWMRPKADVTPEQYREFYKSVSGTINMDAPWMTLHWRAEGAFEYTSLLFVPEMKPFDLYDPRRPNGVKLYVKRVFITEGVEGLIPPFLRFVKGVVDSEDLPLNISREMLQSNPVVTKMSGAITRKILSELQQKAEDDLPAFEQFWSLFGPVVKEGLYDAHPYREALCRVARFYSSQGETLVSLQDYIDRMREGQDHIYYLAAPNVETARNSPQLEAFKAKGVEVLFMTDTIDEYWIPMQADFRQKKFKSVTRGESGLEKIKADGADEKPSSVDGTEKLVARLKEILGKEVKDVTLSQRLVGSPVCLVAQEGDVDIQMQKLLKKQQAYEDKFLPVLEINAQHPLIGKLKTMVANDPASPAIEDTAFLLLDQARIVEGEPLKNPAEFVRRMTQAIEKGLLAG